MCEAGLCMFRSNDDAVFENVTPEQSRHFVLASACRNQQSDDTMEWIRALVRVGRRCRGEPDRPDLSFFQGAADALAQALGARLPRQTVVLHWIAGDHAETHRPLEHSRDTAAQ